jgi:hypothetical protein
MLNRLVLKLYHCRLPTTVQGIAVMFSRYLIDAFDQITAYLRDLVIKNTKQGLKILMDRWLLHQPRFIGRLTKNCTYAAMMTIFKSKHPAFTGLLVLGYDPSARRASPEVPASLKILSTLIRCYGNESKTTHKEMRVGVSYRRPMRSTAS